VSRPRSMAAAVAVLFLIGGMMAVRGEESGRGGADEDTDRVAADEPAGHRAPLLSANELESVLAPAAAQVALGAFPGVTVAVGVQDREFHLAQAGAIGWTRNAAQVDARTTRYDLASLTKVVATASAVMLLLDEGRLSLDDPVSRFLPEFSEGAKARVTVRHLLTHTSGLPAGATLAGSDRADRIARAKRFAIAPPAGGQVEYSDIGYIVLWEAAEAAAGEPLTGYLQRKLYGPLGMSDTGFSPGLDCEACAPTGRLRDQSLYRGRPFDPLGQRLDGVGGNSGLFSTARDLGLFMAMIANGGELNGVRILSVEATREFIAEQSLPGPYRLGWELICPEAVEAEVVCEDPLAIGHTGWTGTAIYLEPSSGVWLVALTNRTYEPRSPNRIQEVRREMLRAALTLAADE
jgi:CubicO group peptidase (beta-lactamase class C family)